MIVGISINVSTARREGSETPITATQGKTH